MVQSARGWLIPWGLVFLLTLPTATGADIKTEFKRLEKVFESQTDAGKYREAEKTALVLYRLADTASRNRLQYKSWAAFRLGIVYHDLRRYDESERFYNWSLAVDKRLHGPRSFAVAANLNNLAILYEDQGRFVKAEATYEEALAIWKRVVKPGSRRIAATLGNLGTLYDDLGRYAEAEPLLRRALAMDERTFGSDHPQVAKDLNNLGVLYSRMGRYSQAVYCHERALQIRRNKLPPQHPNTEHSLCNLAVVYKDLGRYAEAEEMKKQALAMSQAIYGPIHPHVATNLNNLGILYSELARFDEAKALYRRAVEMREKVFPGDHPDKAQTFHNLGILYSDLGRYAEAEQWYRRGLEMKQRIYPGEHPNIASSLNCLATLYRDQGRFSKAEELHRQVIEMRRRLLRAGHPAIADSLGNLALVYSNQGRYGEAEALQKEALLIRVKNFGWEHTQIATSLNSLGNLSEDQNRAGEAEYLHKKALEIKEKHFGPEHPRVATSLDNLGIACDRQARHEEAAEYHQRALAMREKLLPSGHPEIAQSLNNLGLVYKEQGRYEEAERCYQRCLTIEENLHGSDHRFVAHTLNNLGWLYEVQGRDAEARRLVDRAIAIYDRHGAEPGSRHRVHNLRAQLAWKSNRREEALADLQLAIKSAEEQRALSSGREADRARVLGGFAGAFEQMADWQAQLGNLTETLAAIERGRARSLWDQMATRAMDPLAGMPKKKADKFRRRQQESEEQIARLTAELQALNQKSDLADDQREKKHTELQRQLARARYEYVSVYADIRSTSKAYRLAIAEDREPVSLEKLTKWVTDQDGLLMEYLLGWNRAFVLVIPAGGEPRLHPLTVDERQARALGVEPGPLTAKLMRRILNGQGNAGVLEQLRGSHDRETARQIVSRLAVLCELLLPEAERRALKEGKYRRLMVVPDGPLARLPFETLVVDPVDDPQYLLDVGPPVLYGPSATILVNLAAREPAPRDEQRAEVLTVGSPRYPQSSGAGERHEILDRLTARSRYGVGGGNLPPLPYSRWETEWVANVFGKCGVRVAGLKDDLATEAAVRFNATDRRILHLACHGLVDERFGNLFGALALTPGRPGNPANDGFLTLAEIYQLDLDGCELAILSACDTNCGPEQRGEGVWALSRGFLVAGSRRVVASNWLVDDQAAASLVSYFCSIVAKAEKEGKTPDYAEALRDAKRWVRQNTKHEEWKSPYYWGTFVLVGPN